jgi:uncharacterized oxidoreductase
VEEATSKDVAFHLTNGDESMIEQLEVRGAPQLYICQIGVLETLEQRLLERDLHSCLVIHGNQSWAAAEPYFPSFSQVICQFEMYSGECTLEEAERFARKVRKGAFQAVIGVGGGKVMDIAKAVGNYTNTAVILIPTLASTCAAWTPLSVFYDREGQFTHYTVFPFSTEMVLVEPGIIVRAPSRFLAAGIADTLAKWYEADVIIRKMRNPSLTITIAHHAARLCRDVLLSYGMKAIEAAKLQEVTPAFLQVIEAIFAAGGMVGGYGDKYGRVAGAHAIHNGLTQAEETHNLLHGEKVAYGILVQLALEANWTEISDLLFYYKKFNFPYDLTSLGLSIVDKETLIKVAEAAALPHESIHLMGNITSEQVMKAIYDLEKYVSSDEKRKTPSCI